MIDKFDCYNANKVWTKANKSLCIDFNLDSTITDAVHAKYQSMDIS